MEWVILGRDTSIGSNDMGNLPGFSVRVREGGLFHKPVLDLMSRRQLAGSGGGQPARHEGEPPSRLPPGRRRYGETPLMFLLTIHSNVWNIPTQLGVLCRTSLHDSENPRNSFLCISSHLIRGYDYSGFRARELREYLWSQCV